MNFALSALVIFVLVLPGLVFRRAFLRGTRGLPVPPRALADEIAWSLGVALVIHAVWGGLIACVRDWCVARTSHAYVTFDLKSAALLVLGQFADKAERIDVVSSVTEHVACVLAYLLSANVLALVCGFAIHSAVSRRPTLRNSWLFAVNGHWHRLLVDGEFAVAGTTQQRPKIPEKGFLRPFWRCCSFVRECLRAESNAVGDFLVSIDAVVEQGKESYIYHGLLLNQESLVFAESGELDQLVLKAASKRLLANETDQFVPIDGTVFVIRYSQIKTLNVSYRRAIEITVSDTIATSDAVAATVTRTNTTNEGA